MKPASWEADDQRTIQLYSRLIDRYGVDVRALDWGSRESQQLRFSVLADVGPLHGSEILDVGCGQGDFYGWLMQQVVTLNYQGIDITPGMIAIARQRFPQARFSPGNLLAPEEPRPAVDYVFASGIFTHRQIEPMAFLQRMTEAMFRLCRRGIAFNCLSTWAPDPEQGEFHADPLEAIAFCRSLSPWIVFRGDYHPRDFTIYVYKSRNG